MSHFKHIDATNNPELAELVRKAEFYLNVADNITCEYCGLKQVDAPHVKFQIDHICPRAFGGTDEPENLADACFPCNQRKKDQRGWITLDGRKGKSHWMKIENGGWHIPIDV